MNIMRKQAKQWWGLLLLLLLLSALRLVHFYADPDLSLTWSTGTFLTDELYHGGNGLKKALTGHWLLSDFNYILMDPLMPFLQWLGFKTLGVSLWTTRLPANLLNLLLMFTLVFYIYRHTLDRKWQAAILAAFLIGTNYYFFIYGRLALLDLPMAALGFLALCFYQTALERRENHALFFWGAGTFFLLLALLMKASAANFMIAFFIFLLLELAIKRVSKKQAVFALIMLFSTLVLHFAILKLIRINLAVEAAALRSDTLILQKLPGSLKQSFYLYLTSLGNPFILKNIPLFLLLILSLAIIYRRYRNGHRPSATDHAMTALLISTLIFHGFFNYHPPRYYIMLSIPLTWFAATLPGRVSDLLTRQWRRPAVLFATMLVILANGWNLFKLGHYLTHPKYSFYQTAQETGRLMRKDSGHTRLQGCTLFDANVHTSIPFVLGVDFDYGSDFSQAKTKHVYLIDEQPKADLPLLGHFRIYEKYTLNLYKVSHR